MSGRGFVRGDGLWQRWQRPDGNGWQVAIEVGAGTTRAPATRLRQIRQEFGLQVSMRRLPGQADGPPGEGDIVARLDAIQILEEEAATGEHRLGLVFSLQ